MRNFERVAGGFYAGLPHISVEASPVLYLEIDAQGVYWLTLRAAQRYALDLYVVTRDYISTDDNLHLIIGLEDQGGGASWILANIKRGDICITADSSLAAKCALRGASALSPMGEQWGRDSMSAKTLSRTVPLPFLRQLEQLITSALARSADLRPTAEPSLSHALRQ